ncbi:MAG: lipase chaperone [Moraxellaceae bacterium]|jgi:lipase chaperone LimK|nr:lipase chaperone [Moraxellaceae bacterium]
MKKKAGLLLLPVIVVVPLLIWLTPETGTLATGEQPAGRALLAGDAAPSATPVHFSTGLEGLPRSLRDTEVDGELAVDENGRLKITQGVRNLFDYFLSAVGEEPVETLLQRLRAYIRHRLPAAAAAEAEGILDGYIAYKKGLAHLQEVAQPGNGPIDTAAMRRQLQQVQALRTQYLSPAVIAAFFESEDVYERYTLARFEILQDPKLTPQARAQQLATAELQLPPELRESLKVVTQVQNLASLTEDWKKRGGSPAELRQIREQLVGPEATGRLEALDRERAAWAQRMSAWNSERAAILGNRSLGEQDRKARLEAMRAQFFTAEERPRVEALEQMHDNG